MIADGVNADEKGGLVKVKNERKRIGDKTTTIADLKMDVKKFRESRGWKSENLKDVVMSLVIEAGELMEHFLWNESGYVRGEARLRGPIADEISDVLWWIVVLAEEMDIDLAEAFAKKHEKREEKFPLELFSKDMSSEERRKNLYRVVAEYRGSHPLAEDE